MKALLFFPGSILHGGRFYYDSTQDALRVKVKNQKLDKLVEWLKYEFIDQKEDGVTIAMSWEKRMIPFKVDVDRKASQIAAFINDFRTMRRYSDFIDAANWCIKYPNQYTTNVGMGRAYSAKGDYKNALTYMEAAVSQAPDEGSINNLQAMIINLTEGKNVN